MPNEEHRSSPTASTRPRRFFLLGAVIAIAITVAAVFVLVRDDNVATTAPSVSSPPSSSAATTRATPNTKAEVTARLQEILKIREKAFAERNASLFDDVYTSDCSCLEAGRAAIAALERENVLWRNRSTSLDVQSAREVSTKLWEVVAVFASDAFRIETEQGQLVRVVPAERIRYRFLLVRSSDSESWRLGNASPVEG